MWAGEWVKAVKRSNLLFLPQPHASQHKPQAARATHHLRVVPRLSIQSTAAALPEALGAGLCQRQLVEGVLFVGVPASTRWGEARRFKLRRRSLSPKCALYWYVEQLQPICEQRK
jgi:hypothetical protein